VQQATARFAHIGATAQSGVNHQNIAKMAMLLATAHHGILSWYSAVAWLSSPIWTGQSWGSQFFPWQQKRDTQSPWKGGLAGEHPLPEGVCQIPARTRLLLRALSIALLNAQMLFLDSGSGYPEVECSSDSWLMHNDLLRLQLPSNKPSDSSHVCAVLSSLATH